MSSSSTRLGTFGTALCATLSLSACAAPMPTLKGPVKPDEGPYATNETGHEYCSRLGTNSDTFAQLHAALGIFATIAAGSAAIIGAALGPKEDRDTADDREPSWAQKNRNGLVIGAGGLMVVPATFFLSRSSSSSAASAAASRGRALPDADAMERCLEARAALLSERGSAASAVGSELKGDLKEALDLARENAARLKAMQDAGSPIPISPGQDAAASPVQALGDSGLPHDE